MGTREAEGFDEDLDSAEYHVATEEPTRKEETEATVPQQKSMDFQGGYGSSSLKECIELLNTTTNIAPAPRDSGVGQKSTDPAHCAPEFMAGRKMHDTTGKAHHRKSIAPARKLIMAGRKMAPPKNRNNAEKRTTGKYYGWSENGTTGNFRGAWHFSGRKISGTTGPISALFRWCHRTSHNYPVVRFSGGAIFRTAIISGGALFRWCAFPVVSFSDQPFPVVRFSGGAIFRPAIISAVVRFSGGALFRWCHFPNSHNFRWCAFPGVRFSAGVIFRPAISGGALFRWCHFPNSHNFRWCAFPVVRFSGGVIFRPAISGGALFRWCHFPTSHNFRWCAFPVVPFSEQP